MRIDNAVDARDTLDTQVDSAQSQEIEGAYPEDFSRDGRSEGHDASVSEPMSTPDVTSAGPKRTRGGHEPTGTSAGRRAKNATGPTAKGERTRAAILRAGRTVFERVGYIDARVSDVVAEARIAHGSFYTYFPSKRELFEQIVHDVGLEINAAVAHAPDDFAGDTLGNLENANRRYLEVHYRYMKIMVLFEQVATIDPLINAMRMEGRRRHVNRFERTVQGLQERGLADPTIDAHSTAGALVAMLSSFAYWSSTMSYDPDTTVRTVTMICARTLGLAG